LFLVLSIAKNSCDFKIMLTIKLFTLEYLIIFNNSINILHTHHRTEFFVLCFLIMVLNDVFYNGFFTFGSFKDFCLIDLFYFQIYNGIFFLERLNVFNRKFQYIFISNSIGNYIFMQAFTK